MLNINIKFLKWIVVLMTLHAWCADAAGDSTNHYRLSIRGGVLFNRNFSNYPLRSSVDEQSVTKYSATPGAAKYKAGFLIGADVLLLPRDNFKFILGVAFTQSTAQYHSSYTSEGPTSRAGFTSLKRATENDYQFSFSALNFEAGIRNRIKKNFFLSTTLVLTSPLKIVRTLNGSTETIYSNTSGAEDRDLIVISNEKTNLQQKAANLSLRFQAEYELKVGSGNSRIFIFRNFGLLYALPWWGVGFAYSVKG